MNKWDRRLLGLAKHVSHWSKDNSTHVGSVIADANHRVISLGYNGPPQRVSDNFASREQKLLRTIHAEQNSILFANVPLSGATIYVTHPPCSRCASVIVQSGIARVVCCEAQDGFAERWADDMREAESLFKEAGVVYEEVQCANG